MSPSRQGERDNYIFNIAADIVVNGMIATEPSVKLPANAIRDEDFKAVFPEEYRIFNDFQSKPQWKFLPTEAFYEE